MKIDKFRKYISWNIASTIGYIGMIITAIFLIMFIIASSGTTIRPDINEYFYEYIVKHILTPYISFYKFQLFLITLCLLASIFEHRYYQQTEQYDLRMFEEHEKAYSVVFVTGLALNFMPLYIFFTIILLWVVGLIKKFVI